MPTASAPLNTLRTGGTRVQALTLSEYNSITKQSDTLYAVYDPNTMLPIVNGLNWEASKHPETYPSTSNWYQARTGNTYIYFYQSATKTMKRSSAVTLSLNGNLSGVGNTTIRAWTGLNANAEYAIPNPTGVPSGYTFIGWFSSNSIPHSGSQLSNTTKPTGNATYHAAYSVTISFVGGTGTHTVKVNRGRSIGSDVTDQYTPAGKRFVGWYTAAEGGTQITDLTTRTFTTPTTYYAHYETDIAVCNGTIRVHYNESRKVEGYWNGVWKDITSYCTRSSGGTKCHIVVRAADRSTPNIIYGNVSYSTYNNAYLNAFNSGYKIDLSTTPVTVTTVTVGGPAGGDLFDNGVVIFCRNAKSYNSSDGSADVSSNYSLLIIPPTLSTVNYHNSKGEAVSYTNTFTSASNYKRSLIVFSDKTNDYDKSTSESAWKLWTFTGGTGNSSVSIVGMGSLVGGHPISVTA